MLLSVLGISIICAADSKASGVNVSSLEINAGLSAVSDSWQLARATFLPDTKDDLGFSGRDSENGGYNKGDDCKGYTLSSCPTNGNCEDCPTNSNKKKLTGCKSGYSLSGNACIKNFCSDAGSYKNSIPENYVCTKVVRNPKCSTVTITNCDTCYQGCRKINCDGYPLNCSADIASLHIKSLEYCPDCKNKSISRCSTEKCKISECAAGYKLNSAGTACVAKDDNCPNGYYKSCETGTQGDPQYTEAGTACYQCKATGTSCEELGYHTMDYWNKQKPSNSAALETPFQTVKTRFAYIFDNIVGIKSAQAVSMPNLNQPELQQGCPASMKSSCQRNCTTQCQQFFCCGIQAEIKPDIDQIKPIDPDNPSIVITPDCNTCSCDNSLCKLKCSKCKDTGTVVEYEFKVTATCPYDSSYVKGEWVEVNNCPILTPAQKCIEEGYKTMTDWNKENPGNSIIQTPGTGITLPDQGITIKPISSNQYDSSRFVRWIKELVGIKNAQATSVVVNCAVAHQYNCQGAFADCAECKQITGPIVSLKPYAFDQTAVCPYDSTYVKGKWVEYSTAKSGGSAVDCGSSVHINCSGTDYCCESGHASCSEATKTPTRYPDGTMTRLYCSLAAKRSCSEKACSGYEDYIPRSGIGWSSTSCTKQDGNCATGPVMYKNTCSAPAAYNLTTCPANTRCEAACNNKFKVTGCDCGYTLQNGTCVKSSSSGCSVANCKECEPGSSTSCKTCEDGYTLSFSLNGAPRVCYKLQPIEPTPCNVPNCKVCELGSSTSCNTCEDGYMELVDLINGGPTTCVKQLNPDPINPGLDSCQAPNHSCGNGVCCPASVSCAAANSGPGYMCFTTATEVPPTILDPL